MKKLRTRFLSLIMSCILLSSSAIVAVAAEDVKNDDAAYAVSNEANVAAPASVNSETNLTGPIWGTGNSDSGTFSLPRSQYITFLIKAPTAGSLLILNGNGKVFLSIDFQADTSTYRRYTLRNTTGQFALLSAGNYQWVLTLPNNNQLWVGQIDGTDFTYE